MKGIWDQPSMSGGISWQVCSVHKQTGRKHCRILVELLTEHINLQYILQKMRRARTLSCRCAEKETSVHILYECPVLKKIRMQILGFARMDPEEIKEAKLSSIMTLGKGTGLLNSPINFNDTNRAMGQWG